MSEEIRIGAFICDCGSNIAGIVNVPEVVEYARGLKHVVLADEGKWSCSVDYLATMKELIKEHNLNRVVIASCTPRTHESLFKRTVKEAGLNPYLLEFVSIREQSSWVHRDDPQKATEKAIDLVKMGVAKARHLEEGEEIRLPVKTESLVIGGGIAGMTASLSLADQGFSVVLAEKEGQLGGLLNRIKHIWNDGNEIPAEELVKARAEHVYSHPGIKVYTNALIENIDGYIGNYKVTISSNGSKESFDASTVIVATGMREIEPIGQYGWGDDPRVVTQLQLEGLLRENRLDGVKDVVVINCVNSMNESRGCCSIGCTVSIKNAMALKRLREDINVHVLYRYLCLVKDEREHVEKAKQAGIKFIRFPDLQYPEVSKSGDKLAVTVYDFLLGRQFEIPADLLVLTTGFEGDSTVEQLKGHLKVSATSEGFFQEAHVKLGPLDFPADGIFLCGGARSPKSIKDACEEAMGAAMGASIPMKRGYVEAEGIVADVDHEACNGCSLCAKNCPYGAIQMADDLAIVIKALCKGCGLCAADCPKEAVAIIHYSDDQILAQVEAALEEKPEEKMIGFVCHWCCLGGVDMAGVSRLQYPPNARLIRVMCSARVASKFVLRAFELGAAGVLVGGCEFPTCHYIVGNYKAEKRLERVKKTLAKKGFDPDRLWVLWCSAADGPKFANTMKEMVRQLNIG